MADRPRLTRTTPRPKVGIVHFGPGAFFRAFNAVYTADAMETRGGDWGIAAVSLKSPETRDRLSPQGCAYASFSLAPGGSTRRVIESISNVLVAPEDPDAVLDIMRQPSTRIVSLTITEKGYCHAPAGGRLRPDHTDIAHDLANPGTPRSAPGFIVEALARRRAEGHRPFTVLSCDNLPGNGRLARGVALNLARLRDPGLADWIAREARFPCTMVDRITPATDDEEAAKLAEATGTFDAACVRHEPFRQWVIEENFVDDARPAWEAGGAQFVRDVSAHETMKLRCLNGTHSALAYLGYLAGFETIADAVAEPEFAGYCERLWRTEILPTVSRPDGESLDGYCESLMERYRNPAIRHRTWQIAMDGSQKLPQRLLATAADSLSAGRRTPGIALAVAGWMRYAGGVDEAGESIDVRDPLAERLEAASRLANGAEGKVAALLDIDDVFDPALAADARFREAVVSSYVHLAERGARATVAQYARGRG